MTATCQLGLFTATQPAKSAIRWMGFTPDTPDEEARQLFTARHGYQPQRIKRNAGAVLAGPMNERRK